MLNSADPFPREISQKFFKKNPKKFSSSVAMDVSVTSPAGEQQNISRAELLKKSAMTVLYFYPRDDTPGCTVEGIEFSGILGDLEKMGVQVVGVSRDSHDSHCKFASKHDLKISLISDADQELHEKFDVIREKKMYGKTVLGPVRSTFLLDSTGEILKEWRNIRAGGHAQKVLDFVRGL